MFQKRREYMMPSKPISRLRFIAQLLALGAGAIALSRLRAATPAPSASGWDVAPPAKQRVVSPLFDPNLATQFLDDPHRDRWQQPARIVRQLKLHPGDVVADVGAGSGYLMPYLSRAVGPEGGVYAEEIQAAYLPTLRRRAQAHKNVQVVLGAASNPRLPRGGIDCFVLLTVYHEVEDPVAFLRTLRGSGRRDTRLAIIDFDAGRKGTPPAPDGHQIAEATVVEEARKAGWVVSERHDFISSQFFLVFRPL